MVACMICAVASVGKLTETKPSVQPSHAKLKINVFFINNEWNQFEIMRERTRETQAGQVSRDCKLSKNQPSYRVPMLRRPCGVYTSMLNGTFDESEEIIGFLKLAALDA